MSISPVQDNLGGVLYTVTWTTPASGSDFYLDVIAFDKAVFPNFPPGTSPYSGGKVNWRIYDNVGGFSTNASVGNNDILVVSDYALGQKFAATTFAGTNGNLNLVPKLYGAESYFTDVDVNILPDSVYAGFPIAPGATRPTCRSLSRSTPDDRSGANVMTCAGSTAWASAPTMTRSLTTAATWTACRSSNPRSTASGASWRAAPSRSRC